MYISASPPEAPPLSDTTIGCFIRLFFWMAACIIRAIWSDAPPAPAATTISTGFVGSHAMAGALERAGVPATGTTQLGTQARPILVLTNVCIEILLCLRNLLFSDAPSLLTRRRVAANPRPWLPFFPRDSRAPPGRRPCDEELRKPQGPSRHR